MKSLCFIAALFIFPSLAIAQTSDQTNLHNTCAKHNKGPIARNALGQSPWDAGFEFCGEAEKLYAQAKSASDAANEDTNPDLKAARDLAKSMGIVGK